MTGIYYLNTSCYIRNRIIRAIIVHSTTVLLICAGILAKKFNPTIALLKNFDFFCIQLLIMPSFYILFAKPWKDFTSLREYHAQSALTMLPTLRSIYWQATIVKKVLVIIVVSFLFIGLSEHLSAGPWFALILYGWILIRYIKALWQLPKKNIVISETKITIPVTGILKNYTLSMPNNTINDIKIIGSEKTLDSIQSDDLEVVLQNNSPFIQCLVMTYKDHKPKQLILSSKTIDPVELWKFYYYLKNTGIIKKSADLQLMY